MESSLLDSNLTDENYDEYIEKIFNIFRLSSKNSSIILSVDIVDSKCLIKLKIVSQNGDTKEFSDVTFKCDNAFYNDFLDSLIKRLNEIINRDIKDTEGYRAVPVFIQGSEHIPPEPEKVPNLMMYYIYNYNHDEQDIFTKIARYHIEFERIHPFEDGNGRTGRFLNYNFIIYISCYCFINSYFITIKINI